MTDRPLLFSAPMVRALLDGSKTQTRRVNNCLDGWEHDYEPEPYFITMWGFWAIEHPYGDGSIIMLHKQKTGDRIWVKETWRAWSHLNDVRPVDLPRDLGIQYVADDYKQLRWDSKTRVSIHMPRWASRITLLVTDVRVQRLQDISEADAMAEGVIECHEGFAVDRQGSCWGPNARRSYELLWNSINGPGSWEANPWITATTFDVVQTNIGEL